MGIFLESDANNFKGPWRNYLRVRVNIDVHKPLKRRMWVEKPGEDWTVADPETPRGGGGGGGVNSLIN